MSSPLDAETQNASPAPGFKLGSFACDDCRIRKVRCDGQTPCQQCLAANKQCRRLHTKKPRERRQKLPISAQYEKKIELMEERLDTLVNLLADKSNVQHQTATPPQGSHEMPFSTPVSTPTSRPQDSDPAFEGESSMLAHSHFAKNLAEKTLGAEVISTNSSETLATLSQLIASIKPRHESQDSWFDDAILAPPSAPRPELPPFAVVATALKAERESNSPSFRAWFNDIITVEALTSHCMDVYFSPSYTHAQLIIVSVHLMWLFSKEHEPANGAAQQDIHRSNAKLCQIALETTVGNLPFHMPANKETVYAVFLSALHALTSVKPALSWTLTCRAAELCQSLGYHRAATMKGDELRVAQEKLAIFWWVYILDKGLSLRLGRYSNIQDCDVDVSLPSLTDPQADPAGLRQYFNQNICYAQLQGKVYDQLFSARSLNVAPQEREARVHGLMEKLSVLQQELNKTRSRMLRSFGPQKHEYFILQGDEVALLSLSTLVYHSLTPLDGLAFERRCVDMARSALQYHEQCMTSSTHNDIEALEEYINWAILYHPFVPVIVVFCNAIETLDTDDLRRLQGFAASFEPASSSSPKVRKLHDRFKALHEIANRMIELRTSHSDSSTNAAGDSTQRFDYNQPEGCLDHVQAAYNGNGGDLSSSAIHPTQNIGELPAYNEMWVQDYQVMLEQLNEDDLFLFGTNMIRDF